MRIISKKTQYMISLKKIPHTFTIVFALIIICAVATWIVPGGAYQREIIVVDGVERSVVDPDTFEEVPNKPQTWQIFSAFYKGFVRTSNIIVFIFMIGGAFWVMNQTESIQVGVQGFVKMLEKWEHLAFLQKIGVNNIVLTMVIILFSLFGAIFGMSEETIAFIIIFIPLSISMGYDSIVGVLICYVAAHVGFAGALLNPFTIGIAQGFSGLPTFSGIEYRFIVWVILTTITIVVTLLYARKIKRNPKKSMMYSLDQYWRDRIVDQEEKESPKGTIASWVVFGIIAAVFIYCAFTITYTTIHIGNGTYVLPLFPILAVLFLVLGAYTQFRSLHSFVLVILLFTILVLIVGVLGYQWYVMEIATLFFAMGILSGAAFSMSLNTILKSFLDGCKDIMNAALIVGLAGGIIIILEDGQVVDTLLHSVAGLLRDSGRVPAIGGIYVIQNLLNILIPSGSAKAALTIPMMAEFSDIIGIHRQLTVLAFQFGDGFTNMITPTSGVLIGVLGVARIPYSKWVKFIFPFIIMLIIIGFLLLLPPLYFPFNGF